MEADADAGQPIPSGVTSATRKPKGRGRGLAFLCELTAGGGTRLLETGDVSVMCMDGRIAASSTHLRVPCTGGATSVPMSQELIECVRELMSA